MTLSKHPDRYQACYDTLVGEAKRLQSVYKQPSEQYP